MESEKNKEISKRVYALLLAIHLSISGAFGALTIHINKTSPKSFRIEQSQTSSDREENFYVIMVYDEKTDSYYPLDSNIYPSEQAAKEQIISLAKYTKNSVRLLTIASITTGAVGALELTALEITSKGKRKQKIR